MDNINQPKHYTHGSIETIDYIRQVTEHYDSEEAFMIGNVIKYISRAPHKGTKDDDLKKAKWYLDRVISERQKQETIGKEAHKAEISEIIKRRLGGYTS